MKNVFSTLSFVIFFVFSAFSQNNKTLPSVDLSSIDGKSVNLLSVAKHNKLIVVSFWAMWNTNSINQYNAITAKLAQVTIPFYAISIDAKEEQGKITPFIQEKGWRFSFLLDPDKQVFRALGATFPPHVFIINTSGKILWEQKMYSQGKEDELLAKIKELSAK